MVAPDDTTFAHHEGRPLAPKGKAWGAGRLAAAADRRVPRSTASNSTSVTWHRKDG